MQGQHYDEESGLHYNRHRYYDPALGRYITQDPIGLRGGWNAYLYARNPLQQADPLGLFAIVIPMVGWAITEGSLLFGASAAAGGAILATSGDSQKAPTRTAKEEVEAQSEYEAYKSRCEQKPNEGLSKCFAALTNQKRWEDCAKMRQEWDNKWAPGKHAAQINEVLNVLRRSATDVKRYCRPSSK